MKDKPASTKPRSIERQIRAFYEAMPPSERALAERILEYPNDAVLYSATELAELSGASKAAVSRFVKRMGYNDFREMQREIREAQSTGDPIFLTVAPKGQRTTLRDQLEVDFSSLGGTMEEVNADHVEEVAQRIVDARRVVCLGFRNSFVIANYIQGLLSLLRPHVSLAPAPGRMLMEEMGDLTSDDLLITVGLRRRPAVLSQVMAAMQENGVPIAYITDRRAVTTLNYARWSFPCHVRGQSLFDSYVGVMSLANFLCTRASDLTGRAGRERLRGLESMLDRLGELDPNN